MVAEVDAFIVSPFLPDLEIRSFCPAFISKNQQARVCLLNPKGTVKGLPQVREPEETHALEKLCLEQLFSQPWSLSLPLCHPLEFNLTHSPFSYTDFASVSVVPSYSSPVTCIGQVLWDPCENWQICGLVV